MRSGGEVDRRRFVVGASAAGGGLVLGLAIPLSRAGMGPADAPCEINCWLSIAPDDTVTIRTAHAEMGQGAMTALAMLVAEELECDWSKVSTAFVSPGENLRRNRIWGDMSTGASRSVASSQLYLRRAGATAREMLIAAAAFRWNVPASQCSAHNSVITHTASGRSVTFAAVAGGAAKIEPPANVAVKDPRDWKLAGTPRRRLDLHDKVTAQPVFAIDVRLPDMLYAAIVHSPVFGGELKSVDEASIAGMKGVRRIVRMPDAVAVIAESWWQAKRASEALRIAWDDRGNRSLSSATIEKMVREGLDAPSAQVSRSNGDAAAALARAARRIEADYAVPFLAHAT
ncbi:MAG TPA: molybdopterin cofactor-binding domain-containing protein, partial [Xanthobacteraceae bacterium]|nr:molybdopterin cofactor-binding domain-containing protein [Xanthobacteraceae bacterium]